MYVSLNFPPLSSRRDSIDSTLSQLNNSPGKTLLLPQSMYPHKLETTLNFCLEKFCKGENFKTGNSMGRSHRRERPRPMPPLATTVMTVPQNNRFSEEKQSFSACVLNFGTLLFRRLQDLSIKPYFFSFLSQSSFTSSLSKTPVLIRLCNPHVNI